MGRPLSYDWSIALHLVHRGNTDDAAGRALGVSRWTVRAFRRGLVFGKRRGGRPRKADPDTIPARSRAPLAA